MSPGEMAPIVVQYFDWKHGGLQSKLLEVKSTTNETSLTIANEVKENLTKWAYSKNVFLSLVTIVTLTLVA